MIRKILTVILASLMLLPAAMAEEADSALSLYAINVGKADALLLRSGDTAYLIDTGTEDSWPALHKALQAEGITRLDGVILTHTHDDHAGGLKYLLASEITVENVYAPKFFKNYQKEKKYNKHPAVKALAGTGREVVWLSAGDTLPLSGGSIEVVGPVEYSETENCNSLVLYVTGGGGTMLLTGDMEFPEEESLLAEGVNLKADVLKIGNHGEGDATSNALIAAVQPAAAVISTSTEEEPDTPSSRVLKLLARCGAQVYQTQETENGVLITLKNGEIAAEYK